MLRHFTRILGVLLAVLLGLFFFADRAQAQTGSTTCRLGVYVTSLYDINTAAGTFRAEFWMWSVCPNAEIKPLDTLEFVNGQGVQGSLDATLQRGDMWWSTRKFTGVFRDDFQLQNYPFDRQTLTIRLEEAVLDTRDLIYSADAAESRTGPDVRVAGWRLGELTVRSSIASHPTTFGDPSLPGGVSRYASMDITVDAERVHWETFLRVTFRLYIVALLVFAALMFDIVATDMFLGRMGVLGSTLFAVVVSFSSSEQLLGQHQGMYLLDLLHLVVLLLILVATGWAITAHRQFAAGRDAAVMRRRDHWVSVGLVSGFLILNVTLVVLAVVNG
jgi:hypothetical protein